MTSATLTRRPRKPAPPPEARGSVVLAGLAAAAWVIALALAAIVGLAIVGWSTAGSTASASSAAKLGAQLWLLVHHVGLRLGPPTGGSVTFVPLGLSAGVVALMYRGGIVAARSCGARTLADCGRTALAFAAPYATVAVVAAAASRTVGVYATVWQSALYPGLLAAAVAWVAAVRHIGLTGAVVARLPRDVRLVARGAVRLALAWLAAAAVLLAVAAALAGPRVQALIAGAHAGLVGTALLTLGTLVVVPNAIAWAASYALGGGVSVGATAASPFHVTGGALPALPPLAVLPQAPPSAALQFLVAALPLLTLYVALRVERRATSRGEQWWRPYARAAGLAVATSVLLLVAAQLSTGVVGTLALGPKPLRDGGLVLAGTMVSGFVVAALRTWQRFDPRFARLVALIVARVESVVLGVRHRLTGR